MSDAAPQPLAYVASCREETPALDQLRRKLRGRNSEVVALIERKGRDIGRHTGSARWDIEHALQAIKTRPVLE